MCTQISFARWVIGSVSGKRLSRRVGCVGPKMDRFSRPAGRQRFEDEAANTNGAQETTMSTISRIEATNVFCFSTFVLDVPPGGVIIEGGNHEGKTKILELIRAALVEKGCTKDMIRKGADKGKIQVQVDGYLVKRVMNGGDKFRPTLRVTDERGHVVPEPATFLRNLLGLSPLDPIELFLENDKGKRRAKILSAIPCTVTAEQLAGWCPAGANLVELVGDDGMGSPALADHGLEVVERARKALYSKRTEANRLVKERQTATDQAAAKEGAAYDALSAFRIENALPEKATELKLAQRVLDEAKRAEIALDEQARAAEASAKGQARTREKIATLRQKASDARANQPLAPTEQETIDAMRAVDEAQQEIDQVQETIRALEAQLARMREVLSIKELSQQRTKTRVDALSSQQRRAEAAVNEIADLEGQALELEQALGALPIAPSEAQFSDAERRVRQASAMVEFSRKSAELAAHAETVAKAKALLRSAQEDAGALDRAVKALADEAPAALLAATDGIKGLTIDGDDVFLDGVSLDQLSGQERLFFAIEVARRLNAKSKLLCVDGLEALDRKHRDMFIARATEGGYQLIATRVVDDGGDPVAKPILSAS